MSKYEILYSNYDFNMVTENYFYQSKGSRIKTLVIDKNGKKAMFKYEKDPTNNSEAVAEKLAYEIASFLNFECAKIEFARDSNGVLGILNYYFTDDTNEHYDGIVFINKNNKNRKEFYNIPNIKESLYSLSVEFFKKFISLLVFDALIGESDRHEENWGLLKDKNGFKFSPIYDNGCCLLKEFKKNSYAEKYYNGIKNFDNYILRSPAALYNEKTKKRFKHFELIDYLLENYPEYTIPQIKKTKKLSNKIIKEIVGKVPDELLNEKHKEYIILYIIKRRNILLEKIGENYE